MFSTILSVKMKTKEFTLVTTPSLNENLTQKEYYVYSDYRCSFRCQGLSQNVNDVKRKYLNLLRNTRNLLTFNDITQTDIDYYCSNVKPLYIVKL